VLYLSLVLLRYHPFVLPPSFPSLLRSLLNASLTPSPSLFVSPPHSDKFSRYLERVPEKEKEKVQQGVAQVSRVLMELMQAG